MQYRANSSQEEQNGAGRGLQVTRQPAELGMLTRRSDTRTC